MLTLLFAFALTAAAAQSAAAATYTAGRTSTATMMYTGQQNVLSATQARTGSAAGTLDSVSVYVGAVHAAPLNHAQVASTPTTARARPEAGSRTAARRC